MVAGDDYAVAHYRWTNEEYIRGVAAVDVSRAADGRFAEHLDELEVLT